MSFRHGLVRWWRTDSEQRRAIALTRIRWSLASPVALRESIDDDGDAFLEAITPSARAGFCIARTDRPADTGWFAVRKHPVLSVEHDSGKGVPDEGVVRRLAEWIK